MIYWAYPLLVLAIAGFLEVLMVHIAALFGLVYPFENSLRIFGPGLVIVWLPTVLVAHRLTHEFKQKDFWRAALRGCPKWLQRGLWSLCGYAWLGFFILPLIYGGGMGTPVNKARSMSAVLLAFYGVAACLLYSAIQSRKFDESRRCLNGHRISALAKYCEECGAPAQTITTTSTRV
jgi:hypothetical protein